jgi:hypothetical protein
MCRNFNCSNFLRTCGFAFLQFCVVRVFCYERKEGGGEGDTKAHMSVRVDVIVCGMAFLKGYTFSLLWWQSVSNDNDNDNNNTSNSINSNEQNG